MPHLKNLFKKLKSAQEDNKEKRLKPWESSLGIKEILTESKTLIVGKGNIKSHNGDCDLSVAYVC